jgi:hypothetical protein
MVGTPRTVKSNSPRVCREIFSALSHETFLLGTGFTFVGNTLLGEEYSPVAGQEIIPLQQYPSRGSSPSNGMSLLLAPSAARSGRFPIRKKAPSGILQVGRGNES